jgi:hypothetical protein
LRQRLIAVEIKKAIPTLVLPKAEQAKPRRISISLSEAFGAKAASVAPGFQLPEQP